MTQSYYQNKKRATFVLPGTRPQYKNVAVVVPAPTSGALAKTSLLVLGSKEKATITAINLTPMSTGTADSGKYCEYKFEDTAGVVATKNIAGDETVGTTVSAGAITNPSVTKGGTLSLTIARTGGSATVISGAVLVSVVYTSYDELSVGLTSANVFQLNTGERATIDSIAITALTDFVTTGTETSAWTVKDAVSGNTLVAKTFTNGTDMPTQGAATSLGTIDTTYSTLSASGGLFLTVANGTNTRHGDVLVDIMYRGKKV